MCAVDQVNASVALVLRHCQHKPAQQLLYTHMAASTVSDDPTALKELGNKLFQAGDFAGAIEKYSLALNKLSASATTSVSTSTPVQSPLPEAVLYANRAFAHIRTEAFFWLL